MDTSFKKAMGALLGAGLLAAAPFEASAGQGCAASYDVEAALDPQQGSIDGTVTITWSCDGERPADLVLWLYPNRLASPPAMLDAMNTYWIYPHHFTPGGMRVGGIEVNGVPIAGPPADVALPSDHPLFDVTGAAVSVALPDAADETVVVSMGFHVDVPKRYGLVGRARKGMLLASWWYPVVAGRGPDGWDLRAPPAPAVHEARIELPAGMDAVVGDAFFSAKDGDGSRTVHAITPPVSVLAVAVYPVMHQTTVQCHDVTLTWYGLAPRPAKPVHTQGTSPVLGIMAGIPDIMALDRPWHALEVACRTVEILGEKGAVISPGRTVRLVEAPLRLELATATDSFVVVSDRMFDILPVRKAWKFHELALARAVAGHLAASAMPADEDVVRRATDADLVAASVVERYALRWHGSEEDMRDILRYGAFLAAIDYFIYSPLVQFREAYFSTVAEQDWLRDEPWAFMNLAPRGKLVHDKLVDLLGAPAVDDLVVRFLAGEGTVRDLAEEAAGEDLSWFFEQWSVAYPSLNYRVVDVGSRPLGKGRFLHSATVERQGDTSIREPVIVRFELDNGAREDAVWNASGAQASVKVEADAPLDRVVVDPDMRLFEDPSLTQNHPRHDNSSEPSWRPPVFSTFAFTSNITNLTGDIDIVFDMRPKFDVLNSIRFRILLTTWGQGGSVWYTRGFGPKLDLNTSAWHAGVYVSGFHLSSAYGFQTAGDDGVARWSGGTSLSVGLYVGHDDRFYMFNPTDGWSLTARIGYGLGIDDSHAGTRGDLRHVVSASTRVFFLKTPAGGHTLALYGGASGTFGDPYRGQLESLSAFEILRGFDVDETFGRARLYVCAEYRHVFTAGLDVNLFHYVTLQGIQGVLFAGTGTVTREGSYHGLFAADRIFTEVGYGLRGILAYFGAYPGIIAIDLAVPITPFDRPGRLPVALRIAFNHVF